MKHLDFYKWRKMVEPGAPVCNECAGNGLIYCEECDGRGTFDCYYCDGKNKDCDICKGIGHFVCEECDGSDKKHCPYCHGEGKVGISHADYDKQLQKDKLSLKAWLGQ